jgi:ubiquinone/menaquinone biosynthesis C-methylase UbiE
MRRIAVTDGRHANASYVGGPAEQLSFKANAFDAALLSHVYHHVVDRAACDNELFRVLRPDGCVVLRGAFAGRLGEITLFDYFPEAKLMRVISNAFRDGGELQFFWICIRDGAPGSSANLF